MKRVLGDPENIAGRTFRKVEIDVACGTRDNPHAVERAIIVEELSNGICGSTRGTEDEYNQLKIKT